MQGRDGGGERDSRASSKSEPQPGRARLVGPSPDSGKSLDELRQTTLQCWTPTSSIAKWALWQVVGESRDSFQIGHTGFKYSH